MDIFDIFYPHQFVLNEEIVNARIGDVCDYTVGHTPLLKGCMTGTIHYNGFPLYTFTDNNGELVLAEVKNKNLCLPIVTSAVVDYETGIITLTWNKKIDLGKSRILTCFLKPMKIMSP